MRNIQQRADQVIFSGETAYAAQKGFLFEQQQGKKTALRIDWFLA